MFDLWWCIWLIKVGWAKRFSACPPIIYIETIMNKIQRVSLFFRIIFQIIFICAPILLIINWMYAPQELVLLGGIIHFNTIPKAYLGEQIILSPLTMNIKIAACLLDVVPLFIELFVLYSLIKLFKLYERNEIFSLAHVQYIRRIGYALLIGQMINLFYQALMGIILTWHNPPHHHVMQISLDQTNISILLTSFLVILISWVMAEGYQLREEQQLTI